MATHERTGSPMLEAGERERSLEALFRGHARWLTATLRARLGTLAADAEDIVQETYLRIAGYQAAGRVHRPRALLLTIACNLARDRARGQVRRQAAADGAAVLQGGELSPAEQDMQLLLKDAVLSLPAPLRDVFVLSRFTGMSYEEIATHCGISVKTVEWRMSKALALCASRLRG